MKKAISLLLTCVLLLTIMTACGSSLPKKAEKVAEAAMSAMFVWGDEVDQLMYWFSPTLKENDAVYKLIRSNYVHLMNSCTTLGYQYCEYKCWGYAKIDADDSEYASLISGAEDQIKSVRACYYVVEHPSKAESLEVTVYLGKVSGEWYVLRLDITQ